MSLMSGKQKSLATKLLVDLESVLVGWSDPVAFGVGCDGAVYVVARRSTESVHDGSRAKNKLDAPTDYLVVRAARGGIQTLVHRSNLVVGHIQPMADGVLLVGARCRLRAGAPERNAVVIDWSGREIARLTLGDGIAGVRVAPDGTIWVSYFDEGVLGNHGWSDDGPPAIGASGLVAFSRSGEVRFSYDASAAQTDIVIDAYAMNLAESGDVWLYFYSQFPIVRIRGTQYRTWKLGERGAHSIAVRGDRALLFGDYKRSDLARVVALPNVGSAVVVETLQIKDPAGQTLDAVVAVGAGDKLFILENRRVVLLEGW